MARSPKSKYFEHFEEDDFFFAHRCSTKNVLKTFHMHKQLEIQFVVSDNSYCHLESESFPIPKNSILLFNPMELHYMAFEENGIPWERHNLTFSISFIEELSTPEVNLLECFFFRHDQKPVMLSVPDYLLAEFLHLVEQLEYHYLYSATLTGRQLAWELRRTKLILGQVLILVNQLYQEQYLKGSTTIQPGHYQIVTDICKFINEHYAEPISTDSLSRHFGISKTQLYYIFKETYGTTVSEYLNECRMVQAKNFLLNSNDSVETISMHVSYETSSSFSRIFKKRTGYSPLQYRKKFTELR